MGLVGGDGRVAGDRGRGVRVLITGRWVLVVVG